MKFLDRTDAAEQLALALSAHKGSHPLVLAIPRGAVPMARLLAQRLGGDMDVVLVRKLRYPGSPELAMGAMDATGWTYLNPDLSATVSTEALNAEKSYQRDILRDRQQLYFHDQSPIEPRGRTVIVVDDGMATGATMLAALHAVWVQRPRRLVCAVPVASPSAIASVRPWCDDVVCLSSEADLAAIGQFYENFDQVEDSQVLNLLHASRMPA